MALGEQAGTKACGGSGSALLRALWAGLLFVTLLAFTWQSFVSQTHRHWDRSGYTLGQSATPAAAAQAQKGGQAPADTPDNCPICQEVAHGGTYLAPAPILISAPAALAAWFALTLLLALALGRQPHGWRSRAPPLRIQA